MHESREISELKFPAPRLPDAHKGDFGHVLIVAGSPGMTGAAYLAGKAALRSGSGLVTIAIPESLNQILEIKTTCVMTLPVPEHDGGVFTAGAEDRIMSFAKNCDAVALGPGLGRSHQTEEFVKNLYRKIPVPAVIDADALFHLAKDIESLEFHVAPRILTPHPGEFARLTGIDKNQVQSDRDENAIRFAAKHNVICVLKGHLTVISDGKVSRTNTTGNPGMATAGSGDVLTGIIASLLGQNISPFDAAVSGSYLHGLAGDLAAEEFSEHSMIATDILNAIPQAVKRCFRKN